MISGLFIQHIWCGERERGTEAITTPPSLLNWMTDVVYNPNCFHNGAIIAAY